MALNSQWQKEWLPLCSQQLRLRNLTQVLAYNVRGKLISASGSSRPLFYYTLHLTSKSAPFYSSETCAGPNPKWAEIDLKGQSTSLCGTGLVVRIWQCGSPDQLVTVWGLHLSGLAPVPLQTDLSRELGINTLVFFIHGTPFISPSSSRPATRLLKTELPANNVRSSYTPNQLLKLHHIQLDIAHHAAISESLKLGIQRHGPFPPPAGPSGLLGTPSEKYKAWQLKAQCEIVQHRVLLLREEKAKKNATIANLKHEAEQIEEENKKFGVKLSQNYVELSKEVERLTESQLVVLQTRELLAHTTTQLALRRRQLMSQLKFIYPIVEDGQGNIKICDVPLANSDTLDSQDESSSSVALGFVAHATVMVATFLDVPLRYPILPAGSRGHIWDLVSPSLSDSEREFPLFSRGRDKIVFNYAVYLLNKDIAQLRWYCGLITRDLRATLHNLRDLLDLKHIRSARVSSNHKRSLSASSQDVVSSQLAMNVKSQHDRELISEDRKPEPALSLEPRISNEVTQVVPKEIHSINGDETDSHSVSPKPNKNMGSSESWDFLEPPLSSEKFLEKEQILSCSLDQGLDTLTQPKRNQQTLNVLFLSSKATNSSEPSLNTRISNNMEDRRELTTDSKPDRLEDLLPVNNTNNVAPVKSRTYSEPCTADEVTVIEEFHDCTSMPNIKTPISSVPNVEIANECENSTSTASESNVTEGSPASESLDVIEFDNEVLSKLNSIDNNFANVASRTEALASRSGSFNLVKSRASTMENS